MRLIPHISLLCILLAPASGLAQKDELSFFSKMGNSDGLYEQAVRFSAEQDELDYWSDQRAFEVALFGQKPAAYRHYVQAKHAVYAAHRPLCDATCKHGDYYWLQASYYTQFGPGTLEEFTNAVIALPASHRH